MKGIDQLTPEQLKKLQEDFAKFLKNRKKNRDELPMGTPYISLDFDFNDFLLMQRSIAIRDDVENEDQNGSRDLSIADLKKIGKVRGFHPELNGIEMQRTGFKRGIPFNSSGEPYWCIQGYVGQ